VFPDHEQLRGAAEDQQKALLIGIVIAPLARRFHLRGRRADRALCVLHSAWSCLIRWATLALEERRHTTTTRARPRMTRALMPASCSYDGDKFFTMKDGKRR
jgi:hypothetical protein